MVATSQQPHHAQQSKSKKTPPREQDLAGKYTYDGQYTTLMIRNIPPDYTQDELVQEVCSIVGAVDLFDFFYLPWDAPNHCNVGYAFVNFLEASAAKKAMTVFNNYRFRIHPSRKLGKTAYAHIQGLYNNLHHLRNRAVAQANRECAPIIMHAGRKIEVSKVFNDVSQGGLPGLADHNPTYSPESSAQGRRLSQQPHPSPPLSEARAGAVDNGRVAESPQIWPEQTRQLHQDMPIKDALPADLKAAFDDEEFAMKGIGYALSTLNEALAAGYASHPLQPGLVSAPPSPTRLPVPYQVDEPSHGGDGQSSEELWPQPQQQQIRHEQYFNGQHPNLQQQQQQLLWLQQQQLFDQQMRPQQSGQQLWRAPPLSDHGGTIAAEDTHVPMQRLQSDTSSCSLGMPFPSGDDVPILAHWLQPHMRQQAQGDHSNLASQPPCQIGQTGVREIQMPDCKSRMLLKFMTKYGSS